MTGRALADRAAELARLYPNGPARQEAPIVSADTIRNLLNYAGAALLAIALGMLPVLIMQLDGDGPINWRAVMSAGLTALLTAITVSGLSARFPRAGDEQIASQVNALKAKGVPRHEMVVLSQDEAVQAIAHDASVGESR